MKENKLKSLNGKTYYSFQELAAATGKPVKRRTDDMDKLQAQREHFAGKCKVCGQTLTYHYGTNILTCNNVECKGIRKTGVNDDGTEKVWYLPVIRFLDATGMDIALNLFS